MAMQPVDFISKWKAVDLTERAASHSHFIDLCRLLDEDAPTDADPDGSWYCFERGATKTTGGKGWADVWKRECFGWEYKGKHKDLTAAFVQLQRYALALENPPLLVVCDLDRFEIHTNWTNSVSEILNFALNDLRDGKVRQTLKCVWSEPEKLKPSKTRAALTEEAAAEFAKLAQRLRSRGHAAQKVAHFINRLVFCMFAEDVGLLPGKMFKRMLEHAGRRPDDFPLLGSDLFRAMRAGGRVGFEEVDRFNGGLFDDDDAIPLNKDDVAAALRVASLDWSEIDTSIFGTLFERGLDPDDRSKLGAHYTDRAKVMMIIEPVIIQPWVAEWEQVKATIAAFTSASGKSRNSRAADRQSDLATATYLSFLQRLRAFRVLDPACGSGNFLYLALSALKDLERRIEIEAEVLGMAREFPTIGPEAVKGIEINPYAAELARITVWIGEIQWMRRNGFDVSRDPILKPLDTIECRDAILNPDGTEAAWPDANVVIGNPPFLGGKLLRTSRGDIYVDRLFAAYAGRVPAEADLVTYWFIKAWERIRDHRVARAGLVATNSIRGGPNRRVLDTIAADGTIFNAWADERWVIDGAAVRVSLVCFAAKSDELVSRLNGTLMDKINADLTATHLDLTIAQRISQNASVAFMGDTKGGSFDISGSLARNWLRLPMNPNGRPNADVLRPWVNGRDLTRRSADKWIIDFGSEMTKSDAAFYEAPFEHAEAIIKPERAANRRDAYRLNWWRHVEARTGMWRALRGLARFVATPTIAKHRLFVWINAAICPDHQLIVIARDDDTTFGVLHSRFHEAWSLGLCTWLGVGNDPRYTPSTTFETFPFPDGLTPNIPAVEYANDPRALAIADKAKRLNELREAWLNPPDLVRREPEATPGFPDRILPVDEKAAAILKTRTLTNLYNERPAWLANSHRDLDAAVATAYGWPADISEDDALLRLLNLNQSRAATQAAQSRTIKQPGPQRTLLLPIVGAKPQPLADGAVAEAPPTQKSQRGERKRQSR
jgi:type II restriction/modification system DNA methylase subunit YeeA